VMGYQFMQAVNNAMSPEESMKALQAAQIPIYAGSEMDPASTKIAGGTINIMGKMMGPNVKLAMVAFRCPEVASKVHPWYAQQTTAMGYAERSNGEKNNPVGRNMEQHMYVKGDEMILVQTQDPEPGKTGSMLILAQDQRVVFCILCLLSGTGRRQGVGSVRTLTVSTLHRCSARYPAGYPPEAPGGVCRRGHCRRSRALRSGPH
jgi:hypothetical protein